MEVRRAEKNRSGMLTQNNYVEKSVPKSRLVIDTKLHWAQGCNCNGSNSSAPIRNSLKPGECIGGCQRGSPGRLTPSPVAALGALWALTKLNAFRLWDTAVTDTGVKKPAALTNLTELIPPDESVTPERAQELKNRCPECDIDRW